MPTRSKKIKVVIVDDSTFIRRAIRRMLMADPDFEVAGEAADGLEAMEIIKAAKPDVVTLDVNMPGMSGLTVLKRIMAEDPLPVLMISSLTREGGEITLEALASGAADFIDKSACHTTMDIINISAILLSKLKTLAGLDVNKLKTGPQVRRMAAVQRPGSTASGAPSHLVAIGSSTGGPMALERILGFLPPDYPGAVVVVQHMPPGFTASLAERFDKLLPVKVLEVEDGMEMRAGCVYIARAGYHLNLRRSDGAHRFSLTRYPRESPHTPSVDEMMKSVAGNWAGPMMAVILTGMAADGAKGVLAMKGAGAHVVAQNEASCVVYGMPKAARATGAVDLMLNLDGIGVAISSFDQTSKDQTSGDLYACPDQIASRPAGAP